MGGLRAAHVHIRPEIEPPDRPAPSLVRSRPDRRERNVAYPGFIDAHAHWIGDRDYHGLDSAAEAMDAAAIRGWTSISEQWVNPERLDELTTLAADDALRLRVDAYLALTFEKEFLGDWYLEREPGIVDDHLGVRGVGAGGARGCDRKGERRRLA